MDFDKNHRNHAWWHRPVIAALRGLRQEDRKLEFTLSFVLSLLLFCFVLLRQTLTVKCRPALNLLYTPSWLQTYDPPTSASLVLELQASPHTASAGVI